MDRKQFRTALLEALRCDKKANLAEVKEFKKKVRANKPLPKGFKIKDELFFDDFMNLDYLPILNEIADMMGLDWKVFKKEDVMNAKVTVTFDGLEGTFNNEYQNMFEELDFNYLVFDKGEALILTDGLIADIFPVDIIKFYEQHPEVAKKHGLDLRKYL